MYRSQSSAGQLMNEISLRLNYLSCINLYLISQNPPEPFHVESLLLVQEECEQLISVARSKYQIMLWGSLTIFQHDLHHKEGEKEKVRK